MEEEDEKTDHRPESFFPRPSRRSPSLAVVPPIDLRGRARRRQRARSVRGARKRRDNDEKAARGEKKTDARFSSRSRFFFSSSSLSQRSRPLFRPSLPLSFPLSKRQARQHIVAHEMISFFLPSLNWKTHAQQQSPPLPLPQQRQPRLLPRTLTMRREGGRGTRR